MKYYLLIHNAYLSITFFILFILDYFFVTTNIDYAFLFF